jgi:hypothetical protein
MWDNLRRVAGNRQGRIDRGRNLTACDAIADWG